MSRSWHCRWLAPVLAGWAICAWTGAQEERSSAGGFSEFRIISERNIFNPNRSSRAARAQAAEAERKPAVVESFSLLGTMSYEKGDFAFFGSANSEYKKVLKPADKIAGFTIAEIGPNYVKLATNGQPVELRIGMQMKREEQGEWQVSAASEPRASKRPEPVRASSSSSAKKTEAAPAADESEILKRLLQKRQEEMNK